MPPDGSLAILSAHLHQGAAGCRGAELVHADDHLGIAGLDIVGAVHQPVQVQDPVLLGFEVRVAGLLPGLIT